MTEQTPDPAETNATTQHDDPPYFLEEDSTESTKPDWDNEPVETEQQPPAGEDDEDDNDQDDNETDENGQS